MVRSLLLVLLLLPSLGAEAGEPRLRVPARATGATRLYLVRHAEAWSNVPASKSRHVEDKDQLTKKGWGQAWRTAAALRDVDISAVVHSPATRTEQTAGQILKRIGNRPVKVEARLGPLESGRHPNGRQVSWNERETAWKKGRDLVIGGGESIEQLTKRAEDAIRDVVEANRGKTVLIVSHTEVISALIARAKRETPWRAEVRGVKNASITILDVPEPGGRPRIVLEGKVP